MNFQLNTLKPGTFIKGNGFKYGVVVRNDIDKVLVEIFSQFARDGEAAFMNSLEIESIISMDEFKQGVAALGNDPEDLINDIRTNLIRTGRNPEW